MAMSSARRVLRQAALLARVSRIGARAHGASPIAVARRARRARVEQGYEYHEALREGLLDPAMPDAQRRRHASRYATLEVQRRLNPEAVAALTGEKWIFYRHCETLGLRTPRLLGVLDARGPGWSHTGRVIADAADFASFVAEDLPSEFVVKPSGGYHGRGVRVLRRDGGGLVDTGGNVTSPAGLLAGLRADPEFPVFVVQERLHNHPAVLALVDVPTLQTLRIVTLVDRDGGCEALYGVLKLALTGGDADNFQSGRSGNGLVSVSLEDGRLGMLKLPRADGCGFVERPDVPGTGVRVEGVRLPGVPEARDLAREATLRLWPTRTLGWDVALTPEGPVLAEANLYWWPRSSPEQAGILARMHDA
jgi:hypothetical protein